MIPRSITKDTIPICDAIDTTIELINKGCDTLAINEAQLEKNNWTLTNSSGNPLTIPFHLGPGDTLHLRLRATPTSAALLADSLEVSMHYMGQDTSFGAGLRTSAKLSTSHPSLGTIASIDFDSLAICDSTDSPLALANNGCDTLTITKADLVNAHFELLDTNGNPLSLPLSIPSDSVHNVVVRFVPGTIGAQNTTLRLHYQYFGFDSSNAINLSGIGAPSGTLNYPDSIPFGIVPICDTLPGYDTTLTFRNTSCDSTNVSNLVVPAPFTLLDPTVLPKWLAPGQSITLHVRYIPTQEALEVGSATFSYILNGLHYAGTIALTGTGGPGSSTFETNPPLQTSLLAFPTLNPCDNPDSASFTIYNTGCDTLHVTGITLDPSLTSTFVVHTDRAVPATLAKDDSLHVTVAIYNLLAGTYAGNLNIQYKLANGTAFDSSTAVSLTVTSSGGPSVLTLATPTTIDFHSISGCSAPPDTTITFTYTGCGTLAIHDSLSGTGFVLKNPADSILLIQPGGSVSVPVTYDGTTPDSLHTTVYFYSGASTNPNDTVKLLGVIAPVQTVHFKLGLSTMPVSAGQQFFATLTPVEPFAGAGLNSIHGEFVYRRDNFEVGTITSMTPSVTKVTGNAIDVGKIEYYDFDATGANIALNTADALVSLQLTAMISDSSGGTVSLDSLTLNGGDPEFAGCVLSLGPDTLQLNSTVTFQCGDSLLSTILNGQPIVTSEQPRPNPVTELSGFQTTLNLAAAVSGDAEILLYNALGEEITRDHIALTSGGTVPYTFHLNDLPAGSYYYAIRFTSAISASGTLRGTFVVIK